MNDSEPIQYEFSGFCLIPAERLLTRDGIPVPLPPRVFDTLLLLIENEGHLLEKDRFLETIWSDSFVEESTLAKAVSTLRKALGETAQHEYIETVPKSGYRFVAEVRVVTAGAEAGGPSLKDPAPKGAADGSAAPSKFISPLVSRPVLATILLTVAAAAVGLLSSWNFRVDDGKGVRSIAVLPFTQIGPGKRDEVLEFGMTDTLITRLTGLKNIAVRPTTAIAGYDPSKIGAVEIGRELQVDAVIAGNIQRSGDRLRVNVQLISTEDGTSLWGERFDTVYSDVFAVQDSIARRAVGALAPHLGIRPEDLPDRRGTRNPDAYRLYVTGRYLWSKRGVENLRESIAQFESALREDPEFSAALSGLADANLLLAEYQAAQPREAYSRARDAVERALELDEGLSENHTTFGYILAFYDWNWDRAEKEFEKAIMLDPNYPTAHQWYGEFLAAVGRFPEAQREFEMARSLDPTSLIVRSDLAGHFYFTRQYDLAIKESEKIIALDPSFPYGYVFKWLALTQKREDAAAARAYLRSTELFGEADAASDLENVLKEKGPRAMWLRRLEQVNDPARLRTFPEVQRGMFYLRVGDKERALKSFEASLERRERWAVNLKFSPEVDPLRSDPRFEALLVKLGIGTSVSKR
ncbi:MAG: winged helix-turn-helix domain-containing protein [Acidobacteriota bacterium]|nr:MAG: winged helix-turn-helix domain-containing protein [Acidobacteriota bacterium]